MEVPGLKILASCAGPCHSALARRSRMRKPNEGPARGPNKMWAKGRFSAVRIGARRGSLGVGGDTPFACRRHHVPAKIVMPHHN